MNKKIYKGYELAQAVDNGILNLEQKVKSADDMTYFDCTIEFVLKDVAKNIIFENFKLIEDNTEEIEELKKEQEAIANPKTMMQEIRFYYDSNKMGDKINEIIRYIKRKDKSNDN